jgi:hypothetical protein
MTDPKAIVAALLGVVGMIWVMSTYPNSSALRPWGAVGADAYLEIANNSQRDLPLLVMAPQVDSAVRFLGIVPKCGTARFKLPYADTKVIVIVGNLQHELSIEKPGTYFIELFDTKSPCVKVAKVAIAVVEFIDPPKWRSSPWFRAEDIEAPFKAVLAGDDTVCPVFKLDVEPIRVGALHTCEVPWRTRRP